MKRIPSPSERAAAVALETAGFTDLRFLDEPGDERTADLLAVRHGLLWAVEMRQATVRLGEDGRFIPRADGKPLPYPTLTEYLALLWREKSGQLEATRRRHDCHSALLLVTVVGIPGPLWACALAETWRAAGAPKETALALSTVNGLLTFPSI